MKERTPDTEASAQGQRTAGGLSPRVLFVLTNHTLLGDADDASAEPTGYHLSETAHPWHMMTAAGFAVTLASPAGGPVHMDPSSADLDDPVNQAFLADARVKPGLVDTPSLRSLALPEFAALYFPGGHGTMWDLPDSADVQHAVRWMMDAGRPVGAVCHGPAALVNVRLDDGSWLVAGKTVSAFTDAEERATGKDQLMPFALASTLAARGATLHEAADFEPAISVDGCLVTGQNPASARQVARTLIERLRAGLEFGD
ncbi:MAG: type 1 glutamine amidotransferase domain-containing protein [Pseudomonadota bacterium]